MNRISVKVLQPLQKSERNLGEGFATLAKFSTESQACFCRLMSLISHSSFLISHFECHMHDCAAIVPAMEVMMVAMIWSTVLTVDHLIFIRDTNLKVRHSEAAQACPDSCPLPQG